MSDFWQVAASWPVRVAVLGGGILLAGRLLLWLNRQPARRTAIGLAAVSIALFVIPLSLLPGWLPVTVPAGEVPHGAVAQAPPAAGPIPAEPPVLPPARSGDAGARAPAVPLVPDTESAPADCTAEPLAAPPTDPVQPAPAGAASFDWESVSRLLVAAYALVAAGFFARLVIGHVGLARIWRSASEPPESVERLFRELAEEICPRAELRISDRSAGPVCFGVLRPRVLVPTALVAAGGGASLRCICAHELGHLRRRDPLAGWLLGMARAVYFVWPWLAGLRREVRLAQECLADTDAARYAAGPIDYAELLIRMTRARPAPLGAAGARGSSSELYRRVTMLLRNKGQVESRCPRGWKLAVAGGLTALAVIAAGVYVPPRSAKAAEPDKKQSSKPPAKEQLLDDVIEKLKKDVGDDPEKKKQLEELQKQVKPRPIEPPAQAPRSPRPFTVPPLPAPFLDPNLPEDELLKELLKGQEDLFKQLEQMLGQMQQGGQGFAFQLGPDGDLRPLRPRTGGGRLGVRVEKPSDVLASQLDLPAGRGLVCVDVPAQSTAGKVGIKPNDILLEVGGKPVPSDVSAFVAALKDIKPDQPVDIVVLRKGKKEAIKGVKLPEAKEVAAGPVGALPRLPNLQAAPLFPEVPAVPAPPGRGRSVPAPPGKGVGVVAGPGEAVRVEQVNDAFTVFYSKNGVKVTITGSKEDNSPPKAESIEVDDNGKTFKAESIDKLPKEYQDIARSAMKTIK